MSLQSARFRGDLRLEAIGAGDQAQFLRFGDSGSGVAAIQAALIDHGFDIPDGATGFFGQQTADAVVQFKTQTGLFPNDPVAGVGTVTALDTIFALPHADRREWAESFGRNAEGPNPPLDPRPIAEFNFSRFKELTRRLNAVPFAFAPEGVQLPFPFVGPFLAGLVGLLDPGGSPNGAFTDSATWGVSPFDLYHLHLAVHKSDGDTGAWDVHLAEFATGISASRDSLRNSASAVSGAEPDTPAWTQAYRELLLLPVPGFGQTIAQLAANWLVGLHAQSLATGHDLHFLWHSFESLSGRWRPDGMLSTNPRRSWWNIIAPLPGPVVQTPFTAGLGGTGPWTNLGQLAFLIDDASTVTVMAPNITEVAALCGLAMDSVFLHDPSPPQP